MIKKYTSAIGTGIAAAYLTLVPATAQEQFPVPQNYIDEMGVHLIREMSIPNCDIKDFPNGRVQEAYTLTKDLMFPDSQLTDEEKINLTNKVMEHEEKYKTQLGRDPPLCTDVPSMIGIFKLYTDQKKE